MKRILLTTMLVVASLFMIGAPNQAEAKKAKKKKLHHVVHHVRHHRVRTGSAMNTNSTVGTSSSMGTSSVDAQRSDAVAAQTSHPQTVTGSVVSHVKSRAHSISYETWKLTHPNQARAEYDAEQAADAQREAADRAREAQYKKTH